MTQLLPTNSIMEKRKFSRMHIKQVACRNRFPCQTAHNNPQEIFAAVTRDLFKSREGWKRLLRRRTTMNIPQRFTDCSKIVHAIVRRPQTSRQSNSLLPKTSLQWALCCHRLGSNHWRFANQAAKGLGCRRKDRRRSWKAVFYLSGAAPGVAWVSRCSETDLFLQQNYSRLGKNLQHAARC